MTTRCTQAANRKCHGNVLQGGSLHAAIELHEEKDLCFITEAVRMLLKHGFKLAVQDQQVKKQDLADVSVTFSEGPNYFTTL